MKSCSVNMMKQMPLVVQVARLTGNNFNMMILYGGDVISRKLDTFQMFW